MKILYQDKYSFIGSDANDRLLKLADIHFKKTDSNPSRTIVKITPIKKDLKKSFIWTYS